MNINKRAAAAQCSATCEAGQKLSKMQYELSKPVSWQHVVASALCHMLHPTALQSCMLVPTHAHVCCCCCCLSLPRQLLSGLFTRDAAVRQLVGGAVAPATIMLGLAWNNALEGCLLGEQ